jgi:FkbM family methyltransferase
MSTRKRMISYACNHEDVLLSRFFAGQTTGTYIDVGGYHPRFGSVTWHFYQQGWSGVNVEPIPELFPAFRSERSRDINLNVGLSDRAGDQRFYQVVGEEGLSTFVAEQADEYRGQGRTVTERVLPVLTLADLCARHVKGTIDFISIDVEGHERAVLSGGDWQRWRPRVVVIEATRPWSTEPTHHLWEDLLLEAGYCFGAFDGCNRYYVREEDGALLPRLAVPVNIFDAYEPFEYVSRIAELKAALAYAQAQLREAQSAARRPTRAPGGTWLARLSRVSNRKGVLSMRLLGRLLSLARRTVRSNSAPQSSR